MLKLLVGGAAALTLTIGAFIPANAAEAPSESQVVSITSEGLSGSIL